MSEVLSLKVYPNSDNGRRMLQRNHDALDKEQTAAESRTAALIRQSEASLERWIGFIGRQIISRLQIVQRSGIELKDSVGQIISMMFRAVLEFILSERFKGKKGARRIQRRLYSLRESNTQREVDESIPWESAFLSYQKITMSLMCREAGATTSCPYCKTPSDHGRGVEVEW